MWFGAGNVYVSGVADCYPNGTLVGFAKATMTGQAAKWYWRPLNSSCVKMDYESEYFLSFNFILF